MRNLLILMSLSISSVLSAREIHVAPQGRDAHDGGALLAPEWERYGNLPFIPLEMDQVFTIEPRIYIKDFGVATVEEMVVITSGGAEYLSQPQKELLLVKPGRSAK